MESHPNDEKPARPVVTAEHTGPAGDCDKAADRGKNIVHRRLCLSLGAEPGGGGTNQWQQASDKSDASDGYEYPTDDRD